jgi:Ca-activated chloride channel family protein
MGTGLINRNGPSGDISITGAEINGRICGCLFKVEINQEFLNSGNKEADTVYRLTLPPQAFVTGFSAVMAREKVDGFILGKNDARAACGNPKEFNDTALPLQQEGPYILEFAVGLLPPGEKVKVHISYMQQLIYNHNQLTVIIPAIAAQNGKPADSAGQGDPRSRASLKISADLFRRVLNFYSPSHPIHVDRLSESQYAISLSGLLDRDFILHCTCREEESAGGVFCSCGNAGGVIYLEFVPELSCTEERRARDYTFLLDISETMAGEKLVQAKHALNTILRSLSEIDTFKIAAFGKHLNLFSGGGSLPFAQASLDRAAEWIAALSPTSEEADIFKAIRYALPPGGGRKSTVLILTAGRVDTTDEPVNYIYDNIGKSRLFILGTDTYANSCMLRRMAEAGRGRYQCICPGNRIDDRAVRLFAGITSTMADNIRLDWDGPEVGSVFPAGISGIFDLEPVTVLAQVLGPLDGKVVLRGNTDRSLFHLSVDASDIKRVDGIDFLHKALTLQKIKYLEGILPYTPPGRYEEVRNEIIGLSKNCGVPSSLTALVTVHTRSTPVPVPVTTRMVQTIVPGAGTVQHTQPDPVSGGYVATNENGTLTRSSILRILARNQQAGGAFSPDSGDDLLTKVDTTALVLTAFTVGNENIRMYREQLQKSARYLAERITNGGITPELSRNSEALLKTVLALKLCLSSNILNDTTREWVMQCMDDIRTASEASISLAGCRDEILELLDKDEWKENDTIKKIVAVDEDPGTLLDRIGLSADEGFAIPALAKLAIYQAITQ